MEMPMMALKRKISKNQGDQILISKLANVASLKEQDPYTFATSSKQNSIDKIERLQLKRIASISKAEA